MRCPPGSQRAGAYAIGRGVTRLRRRRHLGAALRWPGMASGARDVPLLFASRAVRLFAFGLLSVVLVLHLTAAGLDERQVGLLLSLTLVGDAALSLWVTTRADRL